MDGTPFTATGGLRAGSFNATFPFATLTAGPEALGLKAPFVDYRFAPADVVTVERLVWCPVIAWGVRVVHNRPDCPRRIIFWCLGSPDPILQGIAASGFRAAGTAVDLPPDPGWTVRSPVRWQASVVLNLIWLVLLWPAFFSPAHSNRLPPQAVLAPLLLFAATLATLCFPGFRHLILKPERNTPQIRPILMGILALSGFISVVWIVVAFAGR